MYGYVHDHLLCKVRRLPHALIHAVTLVTMSHSVSVGQWCAVLHWRALPYGVLHRSGRAHVVHGPFYFRFLPTPAAEPGGRAHVCAAAAGRQGQVLGVSAVHAAGRGPARAFNGRPYVWCSLLNMHTVTSVTAPDKWPKAPSTRTATQQHPFPTPHFPHLLLNLHLPYLPTHPTPSPPPP